MNNKCKEDIKGAINEDDGEKRVITIGDEEKCNNSSYSEIKQLNKNGDKKIVR